MSVPANYSWKCLECSHVGLATDFPLNKDYWSSDADVICPACGSSNTDEAPAEEWVVLSKLDEVGRLANEADGYQLVLEACHADASSDEYRDAQGRFYAAEYVAQKAALALIRDPQLREALKDAERYRWLASQAHQNTAYDRYGDGGHWSIGFFSKDNRLSFDAAIDAALGANDEH